VLPVRVLLAVATPVETLSPPGIERSSAATSPGAVPASGAPGARAARVQADRGLVAWGGANRAPSTCPARRPCATTSPTPSTEPAARTMRRRSSSGRSRPSPRSAATTTSPGPASGSWSSG